MVNYAISGLICIAVGVGFIFDPKFPLRVLMDRPPWSAALGGVELVTRTAMCIVCVWVGTLAIYVGWAG